MSSAYLEVFTPVVPGPSRFADFWAAWPSNHRKVDRVKCEAKWRAKNLDVIAGKIIAHVERMTVSDQWLRGYYPAPSVYINQRRWEASGSAPEPVRSHYPDARAYLDAKEAEWREAQRTRTVDPKALAAQTKARIAARRLEKQSA